MYGELQLGEGGFTEERLRESTQNQSSHTAGTKNIVMLQWNPEPAICLLDENPRRETLTVVASSEALAASDAFKFLFQPSRKEVKKDDSWASIVRDTKACDKNSRWGRIEDKILFKVLRELEVQGVTTFGEILEISEPMRPCHEEMLTMLAKKVQWKGSLINLVNRVKTLFKFSEFSVRELKLLKSLIKKQYKGKEVNYEKLMEEFPGKTLEHIVSVSKQFIKCKAEVKD